MGSSRANVFLTPPDVLEGIRHALGEEIGLDPCTEPDNPTRARRWYSLPVDGLTEPWDATSVYVNPPYGEARIPWVRRCLELGQLGARIVLLIPSAGSDTALGQAVLAGSDSVCFIRGRLDFMGGDGRTVHAVHGSMLVGWSVDLELAQLGVTMRAGPAPVGLFG
jgi:hypothetical protein